MGRYARNREDGNDICSVSQYGRCNWNVSVSERMRTVPMRRSDGLSSEGRQYDRGRMTDGMDGVRRRMDEQIYWKLITRQ